MSDILETLAATLAKQGAPVLGGMIVTAIGGIGPAGPANRLTIGDVETLETGELATATITGVAPAQTLNLGLPKGNTGAIGPAGKIVSVQAETLLPGSDATVVNNGTPEAAALVFGLPERPKGDKGDQGEKGDKGTKAIPAPPLSSTVTRATSRRRTTAIPGRSMPARSTMPSSPTWRKARSRADTRQGQATLRI